MCVVADQRKLLAAVCFHCSNIKLIDTLKGGVSEVHKGSTDKSEFRPVNLCAGEPGKLWLFRLKVTEGTADNIKHDVIELDCNGTKFTPTSRGFLIDLKRCSSFCYLPAPHNALVFSDGKSKVLLSVDCESGEKLWELKGDVDGAEINPAGVTFSPQHQLILLADYHNSRVLALDPSNGSHLQTLALPEELGCTQFLSLHNEHLFVIIENRSETQRSFMLSCFSLS